MAVASKVSKSDVESLHKPLKVFPRGETECFTRQEAANRHADLHFVLESCVRMKTLGPSERKAKALLSEKGFLIHYRTDQRRVKDSRSLSSLPCCESVLVMCDKHFFDASSAAVRYPWKTLKMISTTKRIHPFETTRHQKMRKVLPQQYW